ncbi:MAG: lysophospholipid acyltransferase family protein [Bacteroidota bacterium]|nr:lysophospholipid acyltransferase family protein [Bacteroidota bacterium]
MSFKNKYEYFFFHSFVRLFSLVGMKGARHFAHLLAMMFFYVIPVRKETVISNLQKAFPGLSQKEVKKIAYRNYYSFCVTLIEIMCIPRLTPEQVKKMVYCSNLEAIKERYELNRGLIFLTAHFGNWELAASSVSLQLGVPLYVVAKPQRNSLVSDWLNTMREKFGNKVVLLGMSFRNIFKVLYQKNIVALVGDQRGDIDGPRVKFMGIDSSVYPGTAVLALRTKSPIAVAIVERQKDFSYRIDAQFIDIEDLEGTDEEKVLEINQRYSNILETYIRRNPEQWFWMHKRWKY